MNHLPGLDVRGSFLAIGRPVDKVLYAGQLQRDLIGRINVKVPAFFAAAAQKCDGFRILPQNAPAFAFGFHILDDRFQVDRNELFHGRTIAPINRRGQTRFALTVEATQ
jgi:hypothetical protein